VANIIQLDKKLKHTKEKKAEIIKKRKILAVQKVFQCMQCAFKCEKCGTHIQPEEQRQQRAISVLRTPYRFCESCAEEYADYIERLKGRGDSEYYWHNEKWVELWKKWIDYQGVINSYLKSKEFRQLLDELKDIGPNK
jgi:DNA-directed RNA polymerase subunit M/transcription elongation factor TFIIS